MKKTAEAAERTKQTKIYNQEHKHQSQSCGISKLTRAKACITCSLSLILASLSRGCIRFNFGIYIPNISSERPQPLKYIAQNGRADPK